MSGRPDLSDDPDARGGIAPRRAYAIGDIHGQLDLLRAAHARIDADRLRTGDATAPVVHLGDLVDRGPDSRGVVDLLLTGMEAGAPFVVLKGNHDHLFCRFLEDPAATDTGLRAGLDWLDRRLGGRSTLASYGVAGADHLTATELHPNAVATVPAAHRRFLAALPLTYTAAGALFVHAGLRPGVPLARQDPLDLMWIRETFHTDRRDHGALVVHGHTPVEAATHYGNRLNLDTGAAFGGPLSAAVIEDGAAWLLTERGREPLRP